MYVSETVPSGGVSAPGQQHTQILLDDAKRFVLSSLQRPRMLISLQHTRPSDPTHLRTPRTSRLDRRASSPCTRTSQLRTRRWPRRCRSRLRNSAPRHWDAGRRSPRILPSPRSLSACKTIRCRTGRFRHQRRRRTDKRRTARLLLFRSDVSSSKGPWSNYCTPCQLPILGYCL